MGWPYHLFVLSLALTMAVQTSVELITLHETSPEAFQGLSHNGEAVAISVQNENLKEVSSSVLLAESWIRINVLANYPATNITTVVVGQGVLCEKDQEDKLKLVLPSMKNLYHSLTRWGLQKEIKVSALFGSSCLHSDSDMYRVDFTDTFFKPVLNFLQDINSPYLVNAPSQEYDALLTTHLNAMKNLGFLNLKMIKVVVSKPREAKPVSRKLSSIDSEIIGPFPARPAPLAPTHAPSGSSVPAYAAKTPLPPLVGDISPPPFTLPFAPQLPPPEVNHGSPHYGPHLPPCIPSGGGGGAVPAPEAGVHKTGLWCVAKPSVPPETLQEALDYACGEGAADCEAIQPNGNCYFPETLVAHASYAFNSYWQKTKRNGGTCGFGGTAMLINSDPSYRHCRFLLT